MTPPSDRVKSPSPRRVRILIADDHDVVRMGIRALLESQPGWTVCGEAATGPDAVTKTIELQPDLVILDISMPLMNGLDATRQIHRAVSAPVLILTMYDSEPLAQDVIEAGASGFLSKSDAGHLLLDSVRALLERQTFISERVRHGFKHEAAETEAVAGRIGVLTPREREVLRLLAEGHTNKDIGGTLDISPKTVETHRAHIFAKLKVHSMSELVRYAIRHRIIEP